LGFGIYLSFGILFFGYYLSFGICFLVFIYHSWWLLDSGESELGFALCYNQAG